MCHRRRVEIRFPNDLTNDEIIMVIDKLGWMDDWYAWKLVHERQKGVITEG